MRDGGSLSTADIQSGGAVYVSSGGLSVLVTVCGDASGTVINKGATLTVSSGSTGDGATLSGGTVELEVGALVGSGAIVFAGSGSLLKVDDAAGVESGLTISGFTTGDTIDLASLQVATAIVSDGEMTVTALDGYSFEIATVGAADGFHMVSDDGGVGSMITAKSAASIGALTTTAFAALSVTAIAGLSITQLADLTTTALNALADDGDLGTLTVTQTGNLSTT